MEVDLSVFKTIFEAPRVFFEDNLTRFMSKSGLHFMEATVAKTFVAPEPIRIISQRMDRAGLTSKALLKDYNIRYPNKKLPDPYDD